MCGAGIQGGGDWDGFVEGYEEDTQLWIEEVAVVIVIGGFRGGE